MEPVHRARSGASRAKRWVIDVYGVARHRWTSERARRQAIAPGITVVTANWNTLPFLGVFVETVLANSPVGTRILVIDNASTDGSSDFLRGRQDIESILLPVNVRHGAALDIAVAATRTDTVVVLDVDAFPLSEDWLDRSLEALGNGAVLSGAYFHRNFIHPCFMVFRRETIVGNRLSFRPVGRHPSPIRKRFGLFLDVAEAISQAVIVKHGQDALHQISPTETLGPDMGSTVFGNVIFHNFHSTYGHSREAALSRFGEAVKRFGAIGWVESASIADNDQQ